MKRKVESGKASWRSGSAQSWDVSAINCSDTGTFPYSEPRSPRLSRAYLVDEELYSSCNTSESDNWLEADGSSCIRAEAPECFECSRRTEGPMDDEVADFAIDLLKHHLSSMDRNSDLSFKCSGEPKALFSDQAAGTLSFQSRKEATKMDFGITGLHASRHQRESWVSWLTDTSSGDEDDTLFRATALAPPAKISPVFENVEIPPSPPKSKPTLQIPLRSSSIGGTTIAPVHSEFSAQPFKRYSSHSTPASPSRPWTGVRSTTPDSPGSPGSPGTPTQSSLHKDSDGERRKNSLDLSVTSRPLDFAMAVPFDLAMTSPPASPKDGSPGSSKNLSILHSSSKSTRHTGLERHNSNKTIDSVLDSEQGLSAEAINDLLTALENLTSHFATLQPDTPAILAIRSQLAPPSTGIQQFEKSKGLPDLPSPSSPVQERLPSEETVSRRWSRRFSAHRRSASFSIATPTRPVPKSLEATSPAHEFHVPHSRLYRALPPPNMQPLLRIFPRSSHSMCSSLYAYILAHIFTSSLSTANPSGHRSPKKQNTPVWPTIDIPSKAANILGMHGVRVDHRNIPNEELDFNTRISNLALTLRKSIAVLISGMDPETFQENFKGLEDVNGALAFGLGSLFIKSLEEVVRTCEMNSTGYF